MYFTHTNPIHRFAEEAALVVNDVKMMKYMRDNNPHLYGDIYEAYNYADNPKEVFQEMSESMSRDCIVKSIVAGRYGIEVRTSDEIAKNTTLKPVEEDHRKLKVIEGLHTGTITANDVAYMRESIISRHIETSREDYKKESVNRADDAIRRALNAAPAAV